MNNFLNYKKPPCSNCSTTQNNNKIILINKIMPINKIIMPINHNHNHNHNTLHFFPNLNQINDKK
jgi:hypothetical protein